MAGADDRPISLFYSYSHDDEDLRVRLQKHLAVLRRSGSIAEWHDRNIDAGDDWARAIDKNLESADIILLLVSASFIASDYCWGKEMTKALDRHDRGKAKVIPVILRWCLWERAPFAKLQALPKNAQPVEAWARPDEAFHSVAQGIEQVVKELRARALVEAKRRDDAEAKRFEEELRRKAIEKAHAEAEARAKAEEETRRLHKEEEEARRRQAAQRVPAVPAAPAPVAAAAPVAQPATTLPQPKPDIPASIPAAAKGSDTSIPNFTVFRDIDTPWCPELVALPGGSFRMGSPENEVGRTSDEGPQRLVTIGYRLAIGRYPVTFEEYDGFCDDTMRRRPSDWQWGRGRRPVIHVSWDEAQAYCAWLGKLTGRLYRLPSEAEWEYACRAGTTTRYAFGDTMTSKQANFGYDVGKTTNVGAYPANAWGLHDLHGNVWEWVEDVWHGGYEGAPADGSAWAEPGQQRRRVLRGGSWYSKPRNLRAASRSRDDRGTRDSTGGLRVARTLTP